VDRFFRIAKSVAVVAGVWALGWSAVGLIIGIIFGLATALPLAFPIFIAAVVNTTIGFGVLGFAAGVVFSIALALLEWGAPAEELKSSRVALSGAIGGALLPVAMAVAAVGQGAPLMAILVAMVLFSLLGVGTSLGMLRLLRSPTRIQTGATEPVQS
jgi:hypothetical protein